VECIVLSGPFLVSRTGDEPTSHQKIEVGNDNDKDITELDHVFEDLIVENPYKDDALDLCICLIDILTLGKTKPSDLYNEGRRRAIIDQIKLYTKIDFVNVLHFMCSDSVNLRSDFVNLKKLMMNTTNKKSKEFKFERIFAEEGINLDDNKSNKTQDTNTKEDKPEATEVSEHMKYLDTKISHSKGKSIKEYTLAEEKNGYFRFNMEDYSFINDGIFDEQTGLFGVFDGHRGEESVKFVVNFLPEEFKKLYQNSHDNIEQLFSQLFSNTDKSLFDASDPLKESGTTACVCFIENSDGKKTLTVANIGDTRAVLITSKGAERLSFDHRGKDPLEEARVRENGGAIIRERLSGRLAVTRAFGDFELKKEGLICEPFVKKIEVETEGILIIGSDGFWDVTTDEEVATILASQMEQSTRDISSKLIQLAVTRGTKDNITVLTLKL